MMKLKAGVGSAVITPPVGYYMFGWRFRRGRSQGVHDNMYAKAIVLTDEATPISIVTLDGIRNYQKIRKIVEELTGILP